jgi:hypothetical protein
LLTVRPLHASVAAPYPIDAPQPTTLASRVGREPGVDLLRGDLERTWRTGAVTMDVVVSRPWGSTAAASLTPNKKPSRSAS